MADPSPLLVFDLDGTLAETAPDLIAALNVALAEGGAPPVPVEAARDMLGAGGRVLLMRGLDASGIALSGGELEVLYQRFLSHYGEHLADETKLFPGVVAALDALASAGWRLAVCTNKLEHQARMVLEAMGIADRFVTICGQDTFRESDGRPIPKPDPRALESCVARAGGDLARTLLIGDSKTDVDAARASRVPVVAVDFGYTPVPVRELSPDAAISHFDELAPAIAAIVAARGWSLDATALSGAPAPAERRRA